MPRSVRSRDQRNQVIPDDVAVLDDVDGPERLERLAPLTRDMLARPARTGARGSAARTPAAAPDRLPGDVFEQRRILVVDPGAVTPDISLTRPRLEELLRAGLGLAEHRSVVWVRGDSELAVHADRTRVALGPGTLVVGVRVECDQTGPAEIAVAFALGSPDLAAGMVLATPARPDGPPLLVEQWGAVVVAAVYRALLDVVSAVAATAGVDRDGTPLLPGAIASNGTSLSVIPQARHAIDRRQLM